MSRLLVKGGLGSSPEGELRDLDVSAGELFALAGLPSAQSRAILRAIVGLDHSTLVVRLGDRIVSGRSPGDRGIGLVLAGGALLPHLSVRDNVRFPLVSRGAPRYLIEERTSTVARTVGLEHLLEQRPAMLSAVDCFRVAVARALMREPEVLLLDDPLASADGSERLRLQEELRRLHRQTKLTFVATVPEIADAFVWAHRVALYAEGSLRQVGTPAALYENPADRFVAAVVGAPPMNLIRLPVERRHITVGGATLEVPRLTEVMLGLRPDELLLERPEAPAVELKATIVEIRSDGALRQVLADLGGPWVVLRTSRHDLAVGAEVSLFCALANLRLFSPGAFGAPIGWEFPSPVSPEVQETGAEVSRPPRISDVPSRFVAARAMEERTIPLENDSLEQIGNDPLGHIEKLGAETTLPELRPVALGGAQQSESTPTTKVGPKPVPS